MTEEKKPTEQQQKFMAVVNLIDTLVPRGSIRGEELEGIGALRRACIEEYKEFLQAPPTKE